VDEKTFYATVAERAGLSKSEAADPTRATLESISGQVAGGELDRLAMRCRTRSGATSPATTRRRGPGRCTMSSGTSAAGPT
jgi:hypothetical protein